MLRMSAAEYVKLSKSKSKAAKAPKKPKATYKIVQPQSHTNMHWWRWDGDGYYCMVCRKLLPPEKASQFRRDDWAGPFVYYDSSEK